MYVDIGGTTVIQADAVIAVLSIDIEKTAPLPRHAFGERYRYLAEAEEIKSIVVTKRGLYYSPISSFTLKRRLESSIY
ncbi:extracellular matrix regulator RemB [Numidum massiliense]|uniref:extracellular matrix regulator RemB n=1 Tax=Numidum massiliense TaxID=1522315 RepID=UPI0006D53FFB|nr:DUF370 domain-containing protein [Numidum massiliense]